MSFNKINNSIYNVDSDWESETLSKNILKKGWYNIDFSNMDTTFESIVQAGSSIDVDGTIYQTNSTVTPTGTEVSGTNYVRVYDSATVLVVEYTQTAPENYDYDKLGYYDSTGLKRYILQFEYDGISIYNEKILFDVRIQGNLHNFTGNGGLFRPSLPTDGDFLMDNLNRAGLMWDDSITNWVIQFSLTLASPRTTHKYNSDNSSTTYGDTVTMAVLGIETPIDIYVGGTAGWKTVIAEQDLLRTYYDFSKATGSASAPSSPVLGDIWINISDIFGDYHGNIHNGSTWIQIT